MSEGSRLFQAGRAASQAVAAVDELFNVQEQDLILRHGSPLA